MQTSQANQLVLHNDPLPINTVMAIRLLGMFRDSENNIDEVVAYISQNPALAHETLKRCNRLTYRGAAPTTDVFEAVSRLGYYELYGIVAESLAAQGFNIEELEKLNYAPTDSLS
jgi:HD-like signal output (HDOD) protein